MTTHPSFRENTTTSVRDIIANDSLNIKVRDGNELYIEDNPLWMKLCLVLVGTFAMVSSTVSIVVLQRTKKTPGSAKVLSTWLLVFDLMYILATCVRKFILDPAINLNLLVLSLLFAQWAYLTVCIMAIERLVAFNWPHAYLKKCSAVLVRKILLIVCLANFLIFYLARYVGCFLKYMSGAFLVQAGLCNPVMYGYYASLFLTVLGISSCCYLKIFRIIQSKSKLVQRKQSFFNTAKELRSYKFTSLAMVYLLVNLVTSLGYLFVLVLRVRGVLSTTELRWGIEAIAILNTFLDPYLYAMWFRESQMELLKLMCIWNKAVQTRVEQMRIEIFAIVISEKRKATSVYNVKVKGV